MTIVIGTTPTIIFNNFQVVRVGEIKEAVLTIKQGGMYSRAVLIKRDLSTAAVSATEIHPITVRAFFWRKSSRPKPKKLSGTDCE